MTGGIDADLRAGPLVFVDDLDAPRLSPADRHHLSRVLRLRDGDRLCVSDGAGRWRTASLGEPLGDLGVVHEVAAPSPPVTVALALAKGSRTELVVQKLTELGVDAIVLLHTERSVVRWSPADAPARVERMARVAREAAMQSRRVWLPTVSGPVTPAQVLADHGEAAALAEPGGPGLAPGITTVLVGPEGGWGPTELSSWSRTVGLGPTVLRIETAAIAVGALLCARRDGWS